VLKDAGTLSMGSGHQATSGATAPSATQSRWCVWTRRPRPVAILTSL